MRDFADLLPEGYTLLYVTEFGSTLYGTNTPSSDIDYKGIYLPSIQSTILDIVEHTITKSTGNNSSANTASDTDISLYSLQHFMKLLSKGETSALDILFSMRREDTIVYEDHAFTTLMLHSIPQLISKQSNSFTGYCLNQAAKYGIKGSRYGDLLSFSEAIKTKTMPEIQELLTASPYKYITLETLKNRLYISVLGQLTEPHLPHSELTHRVQTQLATYGERTKNANKGIDWKALSHAYRVIAEFSELASTGNITFPLPSAEHIKTIKYCKDEGRLSDILDEIKDLLDLIEIQLQNSTLQDTVSQDFMHKLIIRIYS